MQEKEKKAGKHKYLASSYFHKYCPTHTKELRKNNPVEFIVTYTPTVTSTDRLLLVFYFACRACILNFYPFDRLYCLT